MHKKKWKKIFIWALSFLILLGIGGLFAANYAVDKLISTLSADIEGDLLIEDEAAVVINPNQQNEDNNQTATNHAEETASQIEGITIEPEEEPSKSEQVSNNEAEEDAAEPKDQAKPSGNYSAEVTIDKAKDIQEKITVSEKAKVTSTLLQELSMSDVKELQVLANGGLSLEEKKRARSIILEKLSAEQYDDLIQVAKKYGLSQGKTYDQVIKE